jgi:hypothetical protein
MPVSNEVQVSRKSHVENTQIYEIFALLGCYSALIGSYLPTFRNNPSVPFPRAKQSKGNFFLDCLTLEDGTDMLARNVGN